MNATYVALLTLCAGLAFPAHATSSTPTGAISVAQVVELLQRAPKDNAARNAAMAYLAGVGEATGLLVAEAGRRASVRVSCAKPLGISDTDALAALSGVDQGRRDKTAATPLLVDDMLRRAGCH